MTIQQIIARLKEIKEANANEPLLTKDSIVEALEDIIYDVEGNDGMNFDSDDEYYTSFDEPDFTKLEM